jgi:hypothetical protein
MVQFLATVQKPAAEGQVLSIWDLTHMDTLSLEEFLCVSSQLSRYEGHTIGSWQNQDWNPGLHIKGSGKPTGLSGPDTSLCARQALEPTPGQVSACPCLCPSFYSQIQLHTTC